MGGKGSFGLLLRLALRSLFGHRVKVLIVGSLLAFGTFLLVFGTTLLSNIERAMEASVTGSLTGQIQLVSKKAKDDLAFYGPAAASEQDVGVIESFAEVRDAVLSIPNVKAVIPMGRHVAQPLLGNELDETLAELRKALDDGDASRRDRLVRKLRRTTGLLLDSNLRRLELTAHPEDILAENADLEKAGSDELWANFAAHPQPVLEFMDTRIAKLADEGWTHYIPFIGTDLDAFAKSFESFELVEGEKVPTGHRGFLFNKTFFEDFSKNKVARMLDKVREARDLDGKRIATDPGLQEEVKSLAKFTRYVTQQLDAEDAAAVEAELSRIVPDATGDLDEKVAALLAVDDTSFDARYAFFYDVIAPKIRLYKVKVGDTFTMRSMTRAGYPKAVNVKVYGTFRFNGLERSTLASAYCLMDLMSFRDLFGLMTVEKRAELDSIRAEVGLAELGRDDAEDALFGSEAEVEEHESAGGIDLGSRIAATSGAANVIDTFDPADLDKGTVLHAALLLKDPSRLSDTIERIEAVAASRGLEVKPLPWLSVTGIVGQLILVLRAVLYITIAIIFLVALVIINNSMVMATMDRVAEIGTMRAIGAKRRFVLALFLFETLILGAFASGTGAGLATALTLFLGKVGLPASSSDFLIFLFGGPALYPTVGVAQLVFGLAAILAVSLISTFYPARIAARIAPVVAMQRKE
ncbi:ABC transporter permease [Vulgatibacter incomptus]|uniref:Cell division protein FtsX n=1 Tax=Vulgatibacter incomptus TaxID=1391653 RepID=A0A0K1PF96_9BACT|nr:FtsX-like permease family protein [Vulgatibacter incomptus]AKU92182.1 Cell division protein FtsX [Vulgatibacter incomptus]